MLNSTIHVSHRRFKLSSKDRALFATLAVPRRGTLFPGGSQSKRQYPGESEGAYLAEYLNVKVKGDKVMLHKLLPPLWTMERAIKGETIECSRRDVLRACARLKQRIDRSGSARISSDGLVIPPVSEKGKASLAALLLYHEWRLCRVRRCLHCKKWFYGRVERKRFCSKTCQENHYHTPEWQKKNRERNREHQKAYRKRVFTRSA